MDDGSPHVLAQSSYQAQAQAQSQSQPLAFASTSTSSSSTLPLTGFGSAADPSFGASGSRWTGTSDIGHSQQVNGENRNGNGNGAGSGHEPMEVMSDPSQYSLQGGGPYGPTAELEGYTTRSNAAVLGSSFASAGAAGANGRPSLSRGGSTENEQKGANPEWKYEMRREAQEIIPGLYLGPFQSSLNLDKMKMMGITHVLCIRDQKEARLIYPRFPTEFKYMTLDISDNTDQNLITIFPRCRDFIEEAMMMGGTVLAHCNGGIALSPAIVVGYLMWKFDWPAEYATAFVQNKRYCVSTMSFQNQFKEYEPIQLAQKMVSQAGGMSYGSGQKRQVMEDDDDDDDRRRKQAPRSDGIDISME